MSTSKETAATPKGRPPRRKMALLTWPAAWGLISLILWGLGPAMATWPLLLRTLVISALMVVGLTWVLIPFLTRVFAGWLAPAPQAAPRRPRDRGARPRPSRRLSPAQG